MTSGGCWVPGRRAPVRRPGPGRRSRRIHCERCTFQIWDAKLTQDERRARWRESKQNRRRSAIYSVPADGSREPQVLTDVARSSNAPRWRPDGKALEKGFYFEPTIFARVEPGFRVEQEEIFGPVLSVVRVSTPEEAFRVNNGVKYGLSSSLYTRDVNVAFRALNDLDNGITYINAPTIGAEAHLPFGGNGKSGNGSRQSGIWVLDQFTRWQSMNWDYAGKLQKAQMDVVEIQAQEDFRLEEVG